MNDLRFTLCACALLTSCTNRTSVEPAAMARLGTVDDRYQSYNVEMVEVTGGRFWKPYKDVDALLNAPKAGAPVGMDPALFQQRPPIDLSNPRLRKLAAALGPAYVRVSGTWANSTYFHDSDKPAPATPPQGFNGVLTRSQWQGVVDFSKAVDAKLVTSFATSTGTRDGNGRWTPAQAQHILDYTKSLGGSIAAAEFMNEPTFASVGGAPKGYDAADYGRDLAVFRPFLKKESRETVLLGPGSVGEGISLAPPNIGPPMLKSEDLLQAAGDVFDAFSYHFYGAVSKRCTTKDAPSQITAADALSADWLSRTDTVEAFYTSLRDKFEPGKPLWLTETADAGCGGNPWGSTFLDSFRYLNQLGTLSEKGVQVVAHNTLASSDYGLLDETTLTPRPNYWSAVLWRKFMGATVLDPGALPAVSLRLYAHCLRGRSGGVALLVINTDRRAPQTLDLPEDADRYTLAAANLEDHSVLLNGTELKLAANDELPPLTPAAIKSGRNTFGAATITFLAIPTANNPACK